MIAEYISANQFRVEDDHVEEFKTGRRIKAYCGVDGYVYSTVLSSSYSDPYTNITIVENVLTSNLEDVLYGIVNIGETGAFPDHLHDGTEGQGGALPHITATEFSTYSGTLQTQIDNKPDTFLELIDTPSSYDFGKYARSTSSGIVWTTAGSSNVQTFLDLTDTPTTYFNSGGKFVRSTGSGVIWADSAPPASGIWNYGTATLSGTGDIYCENLHIHDLKISAEDGSFIVERPAAELDTEIVLLLHMEGASGGTTFTDASPTPKTVQVDNATTSTSYYKFGGSSGYFNGSTSKLSIPDSNDWYFGTGPFTIDFWVRPSDVTRNYGTIYAQRAASEQCPIIIDFVLNKIRVLTAGHWSEAGMITSNTALLSNTWCHVAVTRQGDRFYLFINGVLDTYHDSTESLADAACPLLIGGCSTSSYYFLGYIDELCVSKGIAKWTDNFTPPTAPYTVIEPFLKELSYTDHTHNFLSLTDVPNTYSDTSGKFAQSTGSGIVWATASGSGYWYDGYSAPSSNLGKLDDFYINSTSNKIYKKQSSGSTSFTAKSVIIDMTNNWSDASYVGLRSVELYLGANKASTPSASLTGYDTSSAFDPIHAFKDEVSKTGNSTITNGWTSDPGSITNQRIVCVFSSPVTFDSMVINNYHHSSGATTRGAKDINVYYSTDAITTATYGASISNSALIFTGQLRQHVASDVIDNQTLTLINNYSIGWNVVLNTVNSFTGLTDVPSTYSGTIGKFAQSTGSGIVWATVSGLEGGSSNYTPDLTSNLSYSGSSFSSTAGENLLFGDVCYLKNDGKFWKARASSEATSKGLLSLSTGSINTNSQGTFFQVGYIRNNSWNFTVGSELFIPTISGGPTGTAPSAPGNIIRIVGNAYDTNIVWFCPDQTYIELSAATSSGISFLNLSDVPTTYSGTKGMFAQSTGSGIIWASASGSGSSDVQTFLDLTDTPNEYSEGLFAQSTASGIVWATASGSSVQTFIELTDTPSSYVGQEGKFVKVVGNTLEFATVSGLGGTYDSSWLFELDENGGLMPSTGSGILDIQSFLDLTDTPDAYLDGKFAQATTSGIIWATPGSSDVQTFLDLADVPPTYSGTTGKFAQSTGSGIVWATVSGGSGASSFIDLTDTPNSYSNGKFAQSTEDGIVWTTVSGGGTGTSYGELELTYASDIVLDFTEYNLQSVILTGNTNFTFTNMTNGKPCVLNVIQDAQGSRAATFQSNIRWPQGVIPTTSSGSGLYDIFTFIQSRGTICGSCSAAFQLGS